MRLELGDRPGPVVVFTAGGRLGYLEETLASWASVRGAGNATFVFLVEPQDEWDVVHACAAAPAGMSLVSLNHVRRGVSGNAWHAMQTGFRFASIEFVILAEEDTPVSSDVLEYFAWAQDEYATDPKVKAICAHQIGEPLGDDDEVLRSRHFSPVVWGTWRYEWRTFFRDHWGGPAGWDTNVNARLRAGNGQVVIPARSRSQHIGELGGAHCTRELYPRTVSRSFQPDFQVQSWREMSRVQQEEGK
jgi:hypothetical protein